MSQYYRILPLLASAVTFVLFEIIYRTPTWIFAVAMVVPILFWVTLYLIFGVHLKTPSTRIKFLITPVLLTWSALAFSLLLESAIVRHLLAFMVFLFLTLFFESIVTYIWRHGAYLGYSLENLSGYALTITVFLAVSVFSGLATLLDFNSGLIALVARLVFGAVNYELFWVSKLLPAQVLIASGMLTLTLLEIYLALSFLPFHFMTIGAIFTVLWYAGVAISRAHLLGMLTRKMLYRLLALSGTLLLIVFINAL